MESSLQTNKVTFLLLLRKLRAELARVGISIQFLYSFRSNNYLYVDNEYKII